MVKQFKNVLVNSILISLLLLSSAQALQQPTVTVAPDSTNYYGRYTIVSRIANPFPLIQVEANIDSFVVIYNANTILPATIDPSNITVNDVAVSGVNVTGQRISILSPVELRNFLGGDQDFTIVISTAANIRNPGSSGSYTLDVEVVQSTGANIDGPATSSSYSITTSTSTITMPAVAPSPSIAGLAAAYNISFNAGKGGYLNAGSGTITVGFDPATTVPNGSLSGVTVNGTSASATGNNDTVVVTTPSDIDNEAAVNLVFAVGSGLFNPSTGGNYTLGVKTSSENTFVEADSFNIVNAGEFAISAVNLDPDVVNTVSEYTVEFVTSSTGALTANSDTITMIFPPNTSIPSEISTSDVVLSSGGFSDNAASVSVFNSDASDSDTLQFKPAINVGNASNATITINAAAGPLNPSEAGSYVLSLKTSQDTALVQSNSYQVSSTTTTVSQAVVTPTSTTPSVVTSYQVDFNLGSNGRLRSTVSTITMTFNSAHTISEILANYNQSTISIDGGTAVTIPTTDISPSNTSKTVEITLPSSVTTSNNDNVVIFLAGTGVNQPITNPSTSANYTLNVNTSVEETEVSSATYTIGGSAVTGVSIILSDSTVNSTSQYTTAYTIATTLNTLVDDFVKIIFSEGTVLPASINTSDVTINGTNPKFVTVTLSTRTVTAAISQFFITAGSTVTTVFSTNAGIVNPAVPSTIFYKAVVSTSKDIISVNTPLYPITGDNTQATSVSASANPGVRGASSVVYTVNLTTSSSGKLVGGAAAGSSTITVDFDSVTVVPSSISAGNVKVNALVSQNAEIITAGNGGIIRITIPDDLTIDNSSTATVLFDSSAGLNTRDFSGTFNVRVKTSSDTVYSDSTGTAGDYTITDAQDLSITSVNPNPTTQNANASYSVSFITGSLGSLAAEDSVRIIFPSNTSLPATMSKSDILVNGSNPNSNPRVGGDTLVIAVPNAINALTSVTVLINQSAGILNPTLVQSYTLQVITDAEAGPFTSPTYNITQTSSTVSVAEVTPDIATPSSTSLYTIDFNTGGNGRLISTTSTITITFKASTTVDGTASNYDSTYIVVDASSTQITPGNISISGQEITLTVPAGVSIDNNDDVSIILNRSGATKPITNPSSSGNYTLQVKTSVETTNVTSNTYVITSITEVTNISVNLSPAIVNAASTDTVNFRIQQALSAGSGTITITFPFNTLIPTTMSTSYVSIANGADPQTFTNASAVVTNSATRTVTVTVPNLISSGDSVRVAFNTLAGIENPSVFGGYTLQVKTSSQPLNGTSASYSLSSTTTTILNLTLDITPLTPSVDGRYEYNFDTGIRGRLISGTSTISLLVAKDATFTLGTPPPSKVKVNATSADAVVLNTATAPDPDTLVATIPSSVTIGNSTNVTVVIEESAGLRNASTESSLTYGAFTSVETASQLTDFSLPVELSAFSAESQNGKVELRWTTESELENAYWFIERKELSEKETEHFKDGTLSPDTEITAFERAAQIEGMGNTASRSDYVYVDSSVTAGKVYAYRLADVSYNGLITYHNVIYIEVKAPSDFTLAQNYPNPFNPSTTIKYSLPVDANVQLTVYNILGQKVIELVNAVKKSGFYTVQWNGRNEFSQMVATGMYIYRIQWKSLDGNLVKSKMRKMILIK
jgi:hypothetical protein